MKTIEELKAMTAEDLASYAQELQEKVENTEKDLKFWSNMSANYRKKLDALRQSIYGIISLSGNE